MEEQAGEAVITGRRISAINTIPLAKERTEAVPRITVQSLNFYYGKLHALHNVSLEIGDKQVTALIGPSGCGKSTFIRTLNRMNDTVPGIKVEGCVMLDGEDIYAKGIDVVALRRRVGMVFQKPNPFPMSIRDNILYGPRIHGEYNKSELNDLVEHSLQQAALWDEVKDSLSKSAMELSGGQQQRLCIARTLAVQPEVILMDEPCSALDPNSTYRIEQMITELEQKYTIVIVTHNLQQAARVSTKTAFFLKGELVEMEDTGSLFSNPHDKRTEDYVQGRFG